MNDEGRIPELGSSNDEEPFQPGELIWFHHKNSVLVVTKNSGSGFGEIRHTNYPFERIDNFQFTGFETTRRIL